MNSYQAQLFEQLSALPSKSEAFYTRDYELDGHKYRVYSYRLASYSDFLIPGGLESRGSMFEIDDEGKAIRLACLTPPKFFNVAENPMVMDFEYTNDTVEAIMDKLDGSIISTFVQDDKLHVKSKTSLFSEHVAHATTWINGRPDIEAVLYAVTSRGYSIHMELTSPELRIVLGYPEEKLTILSIRDTTNGVLLSKEQMKVSTTPAEFAVLSDMWVNEFKPEDVAAFVASVPDQTGVEGYVYRMKSGTCVKHKCKWYCVLHLTKDSISAPRRLFEAVIHEVTDDLKATFANDPLTVQRIIDMEEKVTKVYNNIVTTVEGFYNENKGLDRKSYAIKATGQQDGLMGLKMNLYVGKPVDYKAFALKSPELFNINVNEVYEDQVVEE